MPFEPFDPDPSGPVVRDPSLIDSTGGSGNGVVGADGAPGANGLNGSSGPIWIPAAAMTPATTNGATPGTDEESTNKDMVDYFSFDPATSQLVWFPVVMPAEWNLGTVTFTYYWKQGAAGSGGVVWGGSGIAVTDNGTLDVALGTEVTTADTELGVNTLCVSAASSAITVGGTPANGKLILFRVARKTADASDTLAQNAHLIGVRITYTNA